MPIPYIPSSVLCQERQNHVKKPIAPQISGQNDGNLQDNPCQNVVFHSVFCIIPPKPRRKAKKWLYACPSISDKVERQGIGSCDFFASFKTLDSFHEPLQSKASSLTTGLGNTKTVSGALRSVTGFLTAKRALKLSAAYTCGFHNTYKGEEAARHPAAVGMSSSPHACRFDITVGWGAARDKGIVFTTPNHPQDPRDKEWEEEGEKA